MPKPVSPVVPGAHLREVVFGADQPEYQPLPAYRAEDGAVLSRWRFTWKERLLILIRGDLYVWTLTFHHPFQPISIQAERPEVELVPAAEGASEHCA